MRNVRLTAGMAALLGAGLAAAHEPEGETIVIEEEAPYVPVSERVVRDRDLSLRPRPRPADILRAVPGIFVNQHAGGGKANQYFLRGFDADHGTDIALSVDGVPVNLVSHGHGQGYADLSFLIPELVSHLDIMKGPYAARLGDFATAGAVDMETHLSLPSSQVSVTGGMFRTARVLGIASPGGSDEGLVSLLAAEAYTTDGPFDHGEDLLRYNVFARATHFTGADSRLSLTLTSYGGGWDASGQIPLRAVAAGQLSRFGTLDPTDGGGSARHSAYVTYHAHPEPDELVHALAYAVDYRLNLYSNFTFHLDEENGDQIEQVDRRRLTGGKARYRFREEAGTVRLDTTLGLEARHDDIDNALHATTGRERRGTRVDARVRQSQLGLFAQSDVRWSSWLRTVLGARLDLFVFDVEDLLEDTGGLGSATSGIRERGLASPKASVVLHPVRGVDVYANFGLGFHSNDARGVVRSQAPATPVARATGVDLGARARLAGGIDVAGSVWLLDLASETVWVGDEGTTESRGRTRRVGAEIEARWRILPWLVADLDATWARARFRDLPEGENLVPLAPEVTLSGGVSALHPSGWSGRLGVRHLSDRPLTEDAFLIAEGFTLLDATLAYRTPRYEVRLAADNLLNAAWREAQFATASRLPGDPPAGLPAPAGACPAGTRIATDDAGGFAGCEDVHFTPGTPLQIGATVSLFY